MSYLSVFRIGFSALLFMAVFIVPFIALAQITGSSSVTYLPILPYDSGGDTSPELLPVISNQDLTDSHRGIKRVLIVLHDRTRDVSGIFNLMTTLAGNASDTTFILAPQFLLDSDMARLGDQLPDHGRMFARWPLAGAGGAWEDGGDSVALSPLNGISSFTAMDLILLYLADRKNFPDLQQVVIAGHGAGGDFVVRYAAMGQGLHFLDRERIGVRFVAANPSSYLYFTASRPRGGKQGFGSVDTAQCPTFNNYRYGLESLNPYGRRIGTEAIKLGYVTRDIVYLLSETLANSDPVPDDNCAAQLQGTNRLLRAMNYYLYLTMTYSDNAQNTQKFVTIPKAGYDPAALFGSKCGMTGLFGDGACIDSH